MWDLGRGELRHYSIQMHQTERKYVLFQVSFIDSWLLSLGPVRQAFVKVMRKSNNPQRHVVYAFGDHYDLRKKLQIINLLTG